MNTKGKKERNNTTNCGKGDFMGKAKVEIFVRVNGKERWADAEKLYEYLYPEKVDIAGKMPDPYPQKVKAFFNSIDEELIKVWVAAYPNVNVKEELPIVQAWLLTNTNKAKKNFKSFTNNWLSKRMTNAKNGSAKESIDAGWDKYK
tara:strand:- start:542 stop:979 length:438 start_codon:yes stop_codon:yes gene_type:complete